MHEGSPATQGSGPERYAVRLAFEMSSFDQFKGATASFELGGFPTSITRQDHFYILRTTGFSKVQEAERFARVIQGAMLEMSAINSVTLWVQPVLPVERNEILMTVRIRDGLAEQHHPAWSRRADGTVTDGGISLDQSCILAEHERIWEYPAFWVNPLREITVETFQNAVTRASDKRNLDAALGNQQLTAAVKFLNLANGEPSREVGYVLFAIVLETLADEDYGIGVGKVVAQCRSANGDTYDETEGQQLYKIRNKLVHEGAWLLDGVPLSWDEFSERYRRIRALAGQAVMLKLNELSK